MEDGPFRSPQPTEDARRARQREVSLERVQDLTASAIDEETRRERRRDAWAIAAFVVSLIATGLLGLWTRVDGSSLPLMCPAIALVATTALVAFARLRARP